MCVYIPKDVKVNLTKSKASLRLVGARENALSLTLLNGRSMQPLVINLGLPSVAVRTSARTTYLPTDTYLIQTNTTSNTINVPDNATPNVIVASANTTLDVGRNLSPALSGIISGPNAGPYDVKKPNTVVMISNNGIRHRSSFSGMETRTIAHTRGSPRFSASSACAKASPSMVPRVKISRSIIAVASLAGPSSRATRARLGKPKASRSRGRGTS